MFKIIAPVESYTGPGFGLVFAQGTATTEDARIAAMLKRKGYTVVSDEEANDDIPPMFLPVAELEQCPLEQLLDYARTHGVDVGKASTEKGILEKIVDAGKIFAEAEN